MERDPAVPSADLSGTRPSDLARRQQLVEHGRLVVADALPEHQRLDRRRGYRHPRQLIDHRGQAVDTGIVCRGNLMPGRQEPAVRGGAHRLDLRPERGQRPAAQDLEHIGVAPLIAVSGVGELATHQATVDGQPAQHVGGDPQAQTEARRHVVGRERHMGAGIAAEQFTQGIGDGFGEARRHADRHRHPDAVTQQADVLDRHPPALARERHRERALGGPQAFQPAADLVGRTSLGNLLLGQRAQQPQQVGDALGVARRAVGAEMLQLLRGGRDDLRVEQLTQLDAAQQLGQQHAVQRQRGGAAFGQRAVALVHECPDIAEQQRGGERGRSRGLHLEHPQPPLRDAMHQLGQCRHVVHILQAFADGLEHDRKVGVLARDVEQLSGALSLMPQWRAATRMPSRQQQRAGRALAEPRGEQGRAADLGGHDRFDLVGVEDEQSPASGRCPHGTGRGVPKSGTVSGNLRIIPSSEAVGFSSMP